MFLVVIGIVACNYDMYVLWTAHDTLLSYVNLAVFHVLVGLLLASYIMCVFTDPGTVPLAWHRMVEASEQLAGEHRFCRKSRLYRPLRSHFDSVTRRVVLNMDHFCPWVVNSVGFYNRKFFILFLFYTLCAALWVLLTSLPTLLDLLHRPGALRQQERAMGSTRYMMACMGTALDAALVLMLSCFLPFHARMAMLNETTIEGPSPDFDVGRRRNWQQVFGRDRRLWLLPVWGSGPDGDGLHWPSPLVNLTVSSAGRAQNRAPASPSFSARDARSAAVEEGRLLAGREMSDSSSGVEEDET